MDFQRSFSFTSGAGPTFTVSTIPLPVHSPSGLWIRHPQDSRDDNQVDIHFHEKPGERTLDGLESQLSVTSIADQFRGGAYLASMEFGHFAEKQMLIEVLNSTLERDFGKHVIPESLASTSIRVMELRFFGYWTDIGTIRSFYEANLDLTSTLPKFNFYSFPLSYLYKGRLLPGSKVNDCKLHQCVISDGCFLDGADIRRHSIIGLRSRISAERPFPIPTLWAPTITKPWKRSWWNVRNGQPNIGIGINVEIKEHAIIDKNARIGNDVKIINAQGMEYFDSPNYYVRDHITVIPSAVLPSGTVI
ncbi:MAG: sugar phosphate nucleotidyltransferase [Terriglobia bacterium]